MKPGPRSVGCADRQPTAALDPDFYPTDPYVGRVGAELILRFDPLARTVEEPACGHGSLAHGLADYFSVTARDLHDYGYPRMSGQRDFLAPRPSGRPRADWVATNPPFNLLAEFIVQALAVARRGVAMFLPVRTLQDIKRYHLLYEQHPYTLFAPFSERVALHKGRLLLSYSSSAFYCWLLWLKPCAPFRRNPLGPPVIPIPPGQRARLFRDSDLPFYEDAGR